MKFTGRAKANIFLKRFLTHTLLCMLLVLWALNLPSASCEAYAAQNQPIKKYAEQAGDKTTTWRFLWVLVRHTTAADDASKKGDVTSDQEEIFRKVVVPCFEDTVYEFSMHYMKVKSDILIVDKASAVTNASYGHVISQDDLRKAIEKSGRKVDSYDQITCTWSTQGADGSEIFTQGWAGLGGTLFQGSQVARFLQVNVGKDGKTIWWADKNTVWKKDGKLSLGESPYYCSMYLHEFLHCMEYRFPYLEGGFADKMPKLHDFEKYMGHKSTSEAEMVEYYKRYFRGLVPTAAGSKKTFGISKEDYHRPPTGVSGSLKKTYKIGSVKDWNRFAEELTFNKKYIAGKAGSIKVIFTANINAKGKKLYTLPSFNGTIEGNGYAIKNAKLGSGALVGKLDKKGKIQNLTLLNAAVKSEKSRVGILVGTCYGKIRACGVTGKISTKGSLVGGICGAVEPGGSVQDCFSGASVSGGWAGGIAGYRSMEGTLKNCYAYGKVKSTDGVGGLIAVNPVENCYAKKGIDKGMKKKWDYGVTVLSKTGLSSSETVSKINGKSGKIWKKGKSYPQLQNAKYKL